MMLSSFLFVLTIAGAPDPAVEAPILPGAAPLQETGRYRSPRNFEETLDFYERAFKQTGGVRWRNIVNLPGIRAKHIESLRKKTRWEGINIYEHKGEVRLFVIARDGKQKPAGTDTSP